MPDVILRRGEPNPNDVRLLVPSQAESIAGFAEGAVIEVQASIIGGVASGSARSGGGVMMLTPSFGSPVLPKKKSAKARGAIMVASVTFIPGRASGFIDDATDEEIEIQNQNFLLMASRRRW